MAQWVLVVDDSKDVKFFKINLESSGHFDNERVIHKLPDGKYAIPVKSHFLCEISDDKRADSSSVVIPINKPPFLNCQLLQEEFSIKKKHNKKSNLQILLNRVIETIEIEEKLKQEFLQMSFHIKLHQHGDLVVLSNLHIEHALWKHVLDRHPTLWNDIASCLQCSRLAVQAKIAGDDYRTPIINLMVGDNGWVEHTDNGVKYVFDVTKCMFSHGNITEKIRMSKLMCDRETVVDLHAGIGYFTLQLLVHTNVKCVHACEWNPSAVESLKFGLIANKISDRCVIHCGDNRKVAPQGIADRVLLGLIPSSQQSWPTACACLRPDVGGWLHIHENVTYKSEKGFSHSFDVKVDVDNTYDNTTKDFQSTSAKEYAWSLWAEKTAKVIGDLLVKIHPKISWKVCVRHIEHVKSYAPHIDHIVADIECRPNLAEL